MYSNYYMMEQRTLEIQREKQAEALKTRRYNKARQLIKMLAR
ncbi:MAG TPA: hypothetical protein VGE04_20420 [Chloroflexia bacterium]|jgi:hypothetical protein